MRRPTLLASLAALALSLPCLGQVKPERLDALSKGINLSHWFSQNIHWDGKYHYDWLASYDRPSDFQLIAGAGFTHVRFPVEFEMFVDPSRPGYLRPETLVVFDHALDEILTSGLSVIVDWHAREETKARLNTDDGFADLAAKTWASVAKHLAKGGRSPDRVFLETMNEPAGGMSLERWMWVQQKLLTAMRENAPDFTIIVTANRWSGIDELKKLTPYSDTNIVYNFHFYEPMIFTHQSATWTTDGLEKVKGVVYPADAANVKTLLAQDLDPKAVKALQGYHADSAWIRQRLGEAIAWGREHHVPLTCNEFGVYKLAAPPESRTAWLLDVRQTLEAADVGWTMWDYAGGFAVTHSEPPGERRPDPAVLAALGTSAR